MDTELKPLREALESNIAIFPFKFKHLALIQELAESHGNEYLKHVNMKELPKIGFIAMLGKTPVACGFLRRVEPNHGIFDSFFTNPYMGSVYRHEGLSKVWQALMEEAKDLKLHTIIGFTKDKGMFERAAKDGFQVSDHATVIKNLE